MLVSQSNLATVVHGGSVIHIQVFHHRGLAVWRFAKALITPYAHMVFETCQKQLWKLKA